MFLRLYIVISSLALVFLTTAALRQAGKPQNLGEITVERINVVDANGTLRLVIANKDRMNPGVMDGKVIDRPRPVAGLLFFNDEGDEVGGLTITGQLRDGIRRANAGLMFDQLKQDQTIGLRYQESNGERSAALEVWDRSDRPLSELITRLNAANTIADPARRASAIQAARADAPPGPQRVFVGKRGDRSASIALSDANGKPRLKLTVEAGGDARIEFLDDNGRVTSRLPQVQ